MKIKRQLSCLLLALAMAFTMMPAIAWAETTGTATVNIDDINSYQEIGTIAEDFDSDILTGEEKVILVDIPSDTSKISVINTGMVTDWTGAEKHTAYGTHTYDISNNQELSINEEILKSLSLTIDDSFTANDTTILVAYDSKFEEAYVLLVKKSEDSGTDHKSELGKAPEFTATIDGVLVSSDKISVNETGYTGTGNYSAGEVTVPLYTIEVPKDSKEISLSFDRGCLVYDYSENGEWKGPWYDSTVAYGGNGITTQEFKIDSDKSGIPNFFQVQEVYTASYDAGDLRYAITCLPSSSKQAALKCKSDTMQLIKKKMNNTYGCEWYAMDLARDGQNVNEDYYQALASKIISSQGSLETGKHNYTNNAKGILALTAGGYDARHVGKYDLVSKLASYKDVIDQGINGPVYALLALDSASYEIPDNSAGGTQATREMYVQNILDSKLDESGVWSYNNTPDIDMTAMVITALAPYTSKQDVADAVDNAISYISKQMKEDGTFPSQYGDSGSNTNATVIWALCANGINPDTDSRFIRNGVSVLDGMLSFAVKNGGFGYTSNKEVNDFSTQQCYEALIAYDKLISNSGTVYKMGTTDKLDCLKLRITKISLSTTTYTYRAKECTPAVTVTDAGGSKLVEGRDYTVSYKNNKNVGKATVKVSGKGEYTGSVTKTFTIKPIKTKISSLSSGKKALTVKWARKSPQVTGYEVCYSRNSKFSSETTRTVSSYKTTSKKLTGLKAGTKYYVKVRTYKSVNGSKYKSDWSAVRSIRTR